MITRKLQLPPHAAVWPFTPDPSPRLTPITNLPEIDEHLTMSGDSHTRSRPISVTAPREGTTHGHGRPTLDDVMSGRAPPPYTLAAYTAFLSQQHCLETLEFTVEAKKYREKYDDAAANMAGMPLTVECDEGWELQQEWTKILDVYVKPGAPREINLPAEERDDLIDFPYHTKPPPPETLDPSVKRMYDLMSDSIFIPFCNSLMAAAHAQSYNPASDHSSREPRLERMTYDSRELHERKPSRRRKEPTSTITSSSFSSSRSPPMQNRPTHSSSLSSALTQPKSNRLSSHNTNSSTHSGTESAITDDSGSNDSVLHSEPDMLSPPTTPPGNELGYYTPHPHLVVPLGPRPQRSESGGWKKMGQKIWGNKKKNGSGLLRESADDV